MRLDAACRLTACLALLGLADCGLLPDAQQQSFTVSGNPAVPPAGAKPFQNTDPKIDAVLAKQICVDEVRKLGQASLPADTGTIEQWRVECAPYRPTLVAGIPLPPIW
jgi:hypothetical protein